MRVTYLLLFVALVLIGCGEGKNQVSSTKAHKIHELLLESNKNDEFSGTALIAHDDSVYTFSLGFSNAQEKTEMKTSDVFYLGSLAKQFTGMAIMLLVDQGKMAFDDPITNFYDSLPAFCNAITVRNMLNHTSGLPDYYGMGIFKPGMTNGMVVEAMHNLDSLSFKPESRYSYSNSAYVILSEIVEKVSGDSFADFLKKNVFEPLEMESSLVFDQMEPMIQNRVKGHTQNGEPNDYDAYTTGGGGIFSNVSDLYKWVRALDNSNLVKNEIDKEAYTPFKLSNDSISYYGFGWRLNMEDPEIVQHSGSLAGFRTYLYRNRSNGTVIILLSNYTNNVSELKSELIKVLNE